MSKFNEYIGALKSWLSGIDFKATWKALPHKGYILFLLFLLCIILMKPLFVALSGGGSEKKEEKALLSLFAQWTEKYHMQDVGKAELQDVTAENDLGVLLNARERAYWTARSLMLRQLKDYVRQSKTRRDFELALYRNDLRRQEQAELRTRLDSAGVALTRERIRRMEEYEAAPSAFNEEAVDAEIESVQERLDRLAEGSGRKVRIVAAVRDTLVGFVFYILDGRDSLMLYSVYDPSEDAMKDPFSISPAEAGRYGKTPSGRH